MAIPQRPSVHGSQFHLKCAVVGILLGVFPAVDKAWGISCHLPSETPKLKDAKPFLDVLTAYGLGVARFDWQTWQFNKKNGVVPHVWHNRPYYMVEVVPKPATSPMLSVADPLLVCLYGFFDSWFIQPLENALMGSTPLGSPLKRGSVPGHFFYDVHVFKFEIDPISDIVANPDKPEKWGNPANWIKDFKPCYFSELDPFRWRYGAGDDPSHRGRFWEGWKSPDIVKPSVAFHPWGSLNDRSGHVAQVNPVWAAIVDALRGAQNGRDGGWGSFCAGDQSLMDKDRIDWDRGKGGDRRKPDAIIDNVDLWIQLASPFDWSSPKGDHNLPIPVGWSPDVMRDDDILKTIREAYWHAPKPGDGYVFLVWLRHNHSLGEEVGELALSVAEKALAAVGIGFIGDIRRAIDTAKTIEEMVKKIQQMIKDLQALINQVQAIAQLLEDIEQIVVEAAKGQAGGAINAALDVAARQIMPDDPDPGIYIRDIECSAMSAWELLEPLETLTSLGVCGKGLSDVKEVAKTRAMIVKVRQDLEQVFTPSVRNILHAGCAPNMTVHAAIESIHNQTDPNLPGSIMGKLSKATKFLKYGDMACSGVKFITKPTTDPVKLLEMFGGVAVPGLGPVSNVVSTIRSLRDPETYLDRALASLQSTPTLGGGGLILPAPPGASLHSSPITLHEKQWWETELKAVKQDFKAVVKLDGIQNALDSLVRGDFLKRLAKPLETQVRIIAGSFKTAGKGAFKDFDAIGDQGKVLVDQVQMFVKLFSVGGMDWQTFVKGVAAIGTIQAEFQNMIKTLALLQKKAPQYATEFENLKKTLQRGLIVLSTTIRTLDVQLAAQITSELGGFDKAKVSALRDRLKTIESRAKQSPAKDLPGFPELAVAAGAAAQALTTLTTEIPALSSALPGLFTPLRPTLKTIADNVLRVTEFLDGMVEATNGLKDMGGGIGADPKGVDDSLGGLFSKPGHGPGLGQILALLGGAARQSRKGSEFSAQYAAAMEAAGGAGAPTESIAEKLAEQQNVQQRTGESTPPKDKAREAWKAKGEAADAWMERVRDPSKMSKEECRVARRSIQIVYDACMNTSGGSRCVHPDSYPCQP